MHDAGDAAIHGFVHQMFGALAPLSPVLIHLVAHDLRSDVERILRFR
jgi:hypothetical protein